MAKVRYTTIYMLYSRILRSATVVLVVQDVQPQRKKLTAEDDLRWNII